jgi:acetolactate synthase-1/2/3 large subunit
MVPDFVKMADAYGALGIRVTSADQVDDAIKLALATNDRPVVIDFIVSRDAMVWPMVPQGLSNSSVQYAKDHAPTWEEE